jgi:hypothetical protein
LGILHGGLEIGKLQFFINLDLELDPDPQLGKMLDPDLHFINTVEKP